MEYLSLFRMPTPMKITGRSSSITNAFINSIIPVVLPRAEEVKRALEILGMPPPTLFNAHTVAALLRNGITSARSSKTRSQLGISRKSTTSCLLVGSAISQRATRNGKHGCSAPRNYLQQHAASKIFQNESTVWMLTKIPRLRQKWIFRPSWGRMFGRSTKTIWSGCSPSCVSLRNSLQKSISRWQVRTMRSNPAFKRDAAKARRPLTLR